MIYPLGDGAGLSLRVSPSVTAPVSPGAIAKSGAAEAAGADFGAVMKQLAGDAVNVLKTGESAAIEGVRGRLPTQDVVEAVMAAEQTLQATIAVRDKVVGAYLELSRMQI